MICGVFVLGLLITDVDWVVAAEGFNVDLLPCPEKYHLMCNQINAVCVPAYSPIGSKCECQYPSARSSSGACKPVNEIDDKTYVTKIQLNTKDFWTDYLDGKGYHSSLRMKQHLEALLQSLLPDTWVTVNGPGPYGRLMEPDSSFFWLEIILTSSVAYDNATLAKTLRGNNPEVTEEISIPGVIFQVLVKQAYSKNLNTCQNSLIEAACSAIGAVCKPSIYMNGTVCECEFPKVFQEVDGKTFCLIDPNMEPYGAVITLENEWDTDLMNPFSQKYLLMKMYVTEILNFLFRDCSAVFADFENDNGKVRVYFYLNIKKISGEIFDLENYLNEKKKVCEEVATVSGLSALTSSLQISKELLTCEKVNICAAGLDSNATCTNTKNGPFCECSPGFKESSGICQPQGTCGDKQSTSDYNSLAACIVKM